jgi:hypothetical protein
MMWLWTAILVGLAGSMHCIGMCGPIALALPLNSEGRINLLISRSVYNFGRILTYGFIGGVVGLAGMGLFLAGAQQWVSIVTGIILILSVLIPFSLSKRMQSAGPLLRFNQFLKKKLGNLLTHKSKGGMLMIGIVNGFLPCGLVYVALAGALNTGQTIYAVAFMIIFGLGTFPVMLVVSIFGQFISAAARSKFSRIIPAFIMILGILFILRGMNLGIKYISPVLKQKATTEKIEECHE